MCRDSNGPTKGGPLQWRVAHVYTHICTHVHTHAYTHVHTDVYTHVHAHVHTHVHTDVYTHRRWTSALVLGAQLIGQPIELAEPCRCRAILPREL